MMKGATLKVAVAHGTANARRVMEDVKAGGKLSECHCIEFIGCPAGCIGGGGQSILTSPEIRPARAGGPDQAPGTARESDRTGRLARPGRPVCVLEATWFFESQRYRTCYIYLGYTQTHEIDNDVIEVYD
jgi:hypothetical protein